MPHSFRSLPVLAALALPLSSFAVSDPLQQSPDWLRPSLHLNAAIGTSTADEPASLAVGHHDPTREDGTVQGLEGGLSLRLPDLPIEGFVTGSLSYGAEEEWEEELEEAFLKLTDLPGGFEVRGGRMLARFGTRNATHIHGWPLVDMPLPLGTFLGDDGLALDGADVTWFAPTRHPAGIVIGFGEVVSHGHEDEHGHEEHGDEEEPHDGDHDEEEHDEHGHEEEHAHAHGGLSDDAVTLRAFAHLVQDDFQRWELGASAALGENEEGGDAAVYGLDAVYVWRENGLQAGGRALRWTTELFLADSEAAHGEEEHHGEEHHDEDEHGHEEEHEHDEDGDHGEEEDDETRFGFFSEAIWTHTEQVDVGLRVGFVENTESYGDRWRASPVATWYTDADRTLYARLQANFDEGDDLSEQTLWFQIGATFGGPEVR